MYNVTVHILALSPFLCCFLCLSPLNGAIPSLRNTTISSNLFVDSSLGHKVKIFIFIFKIYYPYLASLRSVTIVLHDHLLRMLIICSD